MSGSQVPQHLRFPSSTRLEPAYSFFAGTSTLLGLFSGFNLFLFVIRRTLLSASWTSRLRSMLDYTGRCRDGITNDKTVEAERSGAKQHTVWMWMCIGRLALRNAEFLLADVHFKLGSSNRAIIEMISNALFKLRAGLWRERCCCCCRNLACALDRVKAVDEELKEEVNARGRERRAMKDQE